MKQIRKIIQLKLTDPSNSIRRISEITGTSRPVVKSYIDTANKYPLTLEQLKSMNDEKLKEHLRINKPEISETAENQQLAAWLEKNINKLNKKGFTRRLLHELYLQEHSSGLQYSQFCFILRQNFQSHETSSLLEHKAGDKLYVDYTGQKFIWKDINGNSYKEEVFVSVLGASSYFFSLPVPSQKGPDFVYAVEEALQFLKGVPNIVVPDCLKSGVINNDGYESTINPLFQRLMEHYSCICLPARPKHPKDKPAVEAAVNLVYRQIIARSEHEVFTNRSEMLKWWQTMVEKINQNPFQKLPGNRKLRFEQVDKPELKPLPAERFNLNSVLFQQVQKTGVVYIGDDKTSYSVPASLQGEKVEILLKPDRIEVWHENECKAVHTRQKDAGKIIMPMHRPESHKWYSERNAKELAESFKNSGQHAYSWALNILEKAVHNDAAWNILRGALKIVFKDKSRFDTACRIALKNEIFTLSELRRILKDEEDLMLSNTEKLSYEFDFHENLRGPEYYNTQEAC